jgi:hypothetical protein
MVDDITILTVGKVPGERQWKPSRELRSELGYLKEAPRIWAMKWFMEVLFPGIHVPCGNQPCAAYVGKPCL